MLDTHKSEVHGDLDDSVPDRLGCFGGFGVGGFGRGGVFGGVWGVMADFRQKRVCCVVFVLCVVCVAWVLFHGVRVGFMCGCWFQGLVGLPIPWTPSPPQKFFLFFLALGVFSWNFGGV